MLLGHLDSGHVDQVCKSQAVNLGTEGRCRLRHNGQSVGWFPCTGPRVLWYGTGKLQHRGSIYGRRGEFTFRTGVNEWVVRSCGPVMTML